MDTIVYVGMDVHKENFTLSCYTIEEDAIKYQQRMKPDYRQVIKYLGEVRKRYPEEIEFICGYEAGSMGYVLYNQLKGLGIKCVILAPTTMVQINNKQVKTDKRDSGNIAKCLAFRTYSAVHVPTAEDNAVKEYIRMRDAQKQSLKAIKQQILALVLRHGCFFEDGKSYWTIKHVNWLKSQDLGGVVSAHETQPKHAHEE